MFLHLQADASVAHVRGLVAKVTAYNSLSVSTPISDDYDGSSQGFVKALTSDAMPKSFYARRGSTSRYTKIKEMDPHRPLLEAHANYHVNNLTSSHILPTLSYRSPSTYITNVAKGWASPAAESYKIARCNFLMHKILRESNGRGLEDCSSTSTYGLSAEKISNYCHHALSALYQTFNAHFSTISSWPVKAERQAMDVAIENFSEWIFFLDSNKDQKTNTNEQLQAETSL